ncbi:hypothetical protein BC938DRAFT_473274 [Jimgerdemannia flammicorona]|uniref:V-type proton ATPase proteolipid subunit n=1 Tax=Jimgerdemannia flammicorona TaxID=994334 RepID=A0A433Q4S9_9FUNG|nr:hypothetical protein BC938DRAFT_473274 [Jimgerdemannia flammicorona]
MVDYCPVYAPFFGAMGCAAAIVFSSWEEPRRGVTRVMTRLNVIFQHRSGVIFGYAWKNDFVGTDMCSRLVSVGLYCLRLPVGSAKVSHKHVKSTSTLPTVQKKFVTSRDTTLRRQWIIDLIIPTRSSPQTYLTTGLGAAYGTAKSGVGLAAMGILRPDQVMKNIVPVVMAGILGIYGVVVAVLLSGGLSYKQSLYSGFIQFAAGLSVGLSCLGAGIAIGITGEAGVRATAQQPRMFVGMILILIFAEVLGLYGLIVGLILNTKASAGENPCV